MRWQKRKAFKPPNKPPNSKAACSKVGRWITQIVARLTRAAWEKIKHLTTSLIPDKELAGAETCIFQSCALTLCDLDFSPLINLTLHSLKKKKKIPNKKKIYIHISIIL